MLDKLVPTGPKVLPLQAQGWRGEVSLIDSIRLASRCERRSGRDALATVLDRSEAEITSLRSQLEEFKEAAERICLFDWSDNGPDAVRAIGALRILIHGSAK